MFRSAVFVIYDKNSCLDDYIEYLLESVAKNIQYLIVIVNGKISDDGYNKLGLFSDNVVIRNNIGFDIGAYRDAILRYIPDEILKKTDELILMNDTFYGPLFPIDEWIGVFDETIDFWGITIHHEADIPHKSMTLMHVPEHIQSYFIAIRKRMLSSDRFREYWKGIPNYTDVQDVIDNFEVKFTEHFKSLGFKYSALSELSGSPEIDEFKGNIYIERPYELLSECRIPFVKKKAIIDIFNKESITCRIIEWINNNTKYDVKLITDCIGRQINNGEGWWGKTTFCGLDDFYNTHSRIYIFGAGTYGKKFRNYFKFRGWRYEALLTTDPTQENEEIRLFSDVSINDGDGVVAAVGLRLRDEVISIIKTKFCNGNIFVF